MSKVKYYINNEILKANNNQIKIKNTKLWHAELIKVNCAITACIQYISNSQGT